MLEKHNKRHGILLARKNCLTPTPNNNTNKTHQDENLIMTIQSTEMSSERDSWATANYAQVNRKGRQVANHGRRRRRAGKNDVELTEKEEEEEG